MLLPALCPSWPIWLRQLSVAARPPFGRPFHNRQQVRGIVTGVKEIAQAAFAVQVWQFHEPHGFCHPPGSGDDGAVVFAPGGMATRLPRRKRKCPCVYFPLPPPKALHVATRPMDQSRSTSFY